MKLYFLSIGSNIDPHRHIPHIVQLLCSMTPRLFISRIVATEPVGMLSNEPFLNLTAAIESQLSAAALKKELVAIEHQLGRDRSDPLSKVKNRAADIDILFALPVGGTRAPADLPKEPYVRPLLLELLAALNIGPLPSRPALSPGVPLYLDRRLIGLTPMALRFASGGLHTKPATTKEYINE